MATATIAHITRKNPFAAFAKSLPKENTTRELHIDGRYAARLTDDFGSDEEVQRQLDMANSGEFEAGKLSQFVFEMYICEKIDNEDAI
ncbi:MAG: hypothetical protein ACKO0Z_21550 [Betaproteobacteria bacterium]